MQLRTELNKKLIRLARMSLRVECGSKYTSSTAITSNETCMEDRCHIATRSHNWKGNHRKRKKEWQKERSSALLVPVSARQETSAFRSRRTFHLSFWRVKWPRSYSGQELYDVHIGIHFPDHIWSELEDWLSRTGLFWGKLNQDAISLIIRLDFPSSACLSRFNLFGVWWPLVSSCFFKLNAGGRGTIGSAWWTKESFSSN